MSADNWSNCPWCGAFDMWREDYEIGMFDGVFTVGYHGQCTEPGCGKVFTHKHTEVVVPNVKKRAAMREIEKVKSELERLQRIVDEGAA